MSASAHADATLAVVCAPKTSSEVSVDRSVAMLRMNVPAVALRPRLRRRDLGCVSFCWRGRSVNCHLRRRYLLEQLASYRRQLKNIRRRHPTERPIGLALSLSLRSHASLTLRGSC